MLTHHRSTAHRNQHPSGNLRPGIWISPVRQCYAVLCSRRDETKSDDMQEGLKKHQGYGEGRLLQMYYTTRDTNHAGGEPLLWMGRKFGVLGALSILPNLLHTGQRMRTTACRLKLFCFWCLCFVNDGKAE
jgi:hypothetical protein